MELLSLCFPSLYLPLWDNTPFSRPSLCISWILTTIARLHASCLSAGSQLSLRLR